MSSIKESTVLVQGEPMAQQRARALIGWLSRDEAVRLLLGGRNPAPGEDLTRIEARYEAKKAALAKRSEFSSKRSVVDSPQLDLDVEGNRRTVGPQADRSMSSVVPDPYRTQPHRPASRRSCRRQPRRCYRLEAESLGRASMKRGVTVYPDWAS